MTRIILSLALLLPALSGCGGNDSAAPAPPPGPAQPPAPVATELGPAQAVRTVLTGIQDGQANVIWEYLPPTFQSELEQIVQEFAASMDPEVWQRAFATLQRVLNVARTKKELLIKNPALNLGQLDQPQLNESWGAVIDLLEILVQGELANLDQLKTFEGKLFFKGTGTRFLKQLRKLSAKDPQDPLASLDTSQVTLVEVTGDRATVQIPAMSPADDGTAEPGVQAELVKIEGKWFPVAISDALREALRQAHELLDSLKSQDLAKNRQHWLSLLDEVDQAVKLVGAAKTDNQLNAALVLAQLKLMQLFTPANADGQPASTTPGTGGTHTVVVVIRGPLDDVTRGDLVARLRTIGGVNAAPEVTTSDDATTVILKSKLALRQFADKITFGKVTEFSQTRSLITVELPKAGGKKKAVPKKSAAKGKRD